MSLVSQISLLNYEYVPESDDITGRIRTAWISMVRGRLVQLNIERQPVDDSKIEGDRLEGFRYHVRRVCSAEAYSLVPDERAAPFGHQVEYVCLQVANREERGFTQPLFLVRHKSTENPTTSTERVGVSD